MFIVKIQLVSTKKFKIPKEKLIVKLIIRVCIFFFCNTTIHICSTSAPSSALIDAFKWRTLRTLATKNYNN